MTSEIPRNQNGPGAGATASRTQETTTQIEDSMSTLNPDSRFRPGDRVRIAEIDRIGQRSGTYRTGVVIPAPFDDGYYRVQVDGIGRPIVFDGFRLEPIAEQDGPTELDLVLGGRDRRPPRGCGTTGQGRTPAYARRPRSRSRSA